KNNHQCNGKEDGKTTNDPANDGDFQQGGDQGQCQKDNGETGQNFRATGAAEVKVTIVNHHREQDDFEGVAPADDDEMDNPINHGAARRASATRSASTFSSTSCTRSTSAPVILSNEVNATVGKSRSSIEPLWPEIFPRKDLRDTPTTSGRS